jgi:hypothetical protein
MPSPEVEALQAQVAATDGVIDSTITLLSGLADILTNVAGNKAATLAVVDDLKAKTQALADAVANVPPGV